MEPCARAHRRLARKTSVKMHLELARMNPGDVSAEIPGDVSPKLLHFCSVSWCIFRSIFEGDKCSSGHGEQIFYQDIFSKTLT